MSTLSSVRLPRRSSRFLVGGLRPLDQLLHIFLLCVDGDLHLVHYFAEIGVVAGVDDLAQMLEAEAKHRGRAC